MANKIEILKRGQDKIAPRTVTKAITDDNGTSLETILSGKQGTLTAGSNITISSENVISATNSGGTWGSITGTLSNQTDLQDALDEKANSDDLAEVATSGSYNDLSNTPTTTISKGSLETTTIIGTNGTTTASKATAGTDISIPNISVSQSTIATGNLGSETSTQGTNTVVWGINVVDEEMTFVYKPIETSSIGSSSVGTPITITPYTFADVNVAVASDTSTTVATGNIASGTDLVTNVTIN